MKRIGDRVAKTDVKRKDEWYQKKAKNVMKTAVKPFQRSTQRFIMASSFGHVLTDFPGLVGSLGSAG